MTLLDPFAGLGDWDLEADILDCGRQMEASMQQGNREAAESWQQAMYAAIRARDERSGVARHAAFEQRISEGVDFFQSQYAQTMGRCS